MMSSPAVVGWLAHFMIGTLAWGGGLAVLCGVIPGSGAVMKGILFGIVAWLGMMVIVMPMAGGRFRDGVGGDGPDDDPGEVLGAVYQAQAKPAFA